MLTHSSCIFASRSCTRSTAPAPSAQLVRRQVATFEGMRSVGAVHKCAQTPLRVQRRAAVRASRSTPSIEAKQFKVALLGAAGGIGQPLALLLKMNKLVDELALYDVANVVGVAADLSHCNTPVKVLQQPDLKSQADLLMHDLQSTCHDAPATFVKAHTAVSMSSSRYNNMRERVS